MNQFNKIKESLDKLQVDFDKQLETLHNNPKELHKSIIELSYKYPDHKDLLQFIVFINDNLETKHSIFVEIITETFNEVIRLKKELIEEIIISKDNMPCMVKCDMPKRFDYKKLLTPSNLNNIKYLSISLALIFLGIAIIYAPGAVEKLFMLIKDLIG